MRTPPKCVVTKRREKETNGQGENVNVKESSKASMLEREKEKERKRKKKEEKKRWPRRETNLVEGKEHAHLQDTLQYRGEREKAMVK